MRTSTISSFLVSTFVFGSSAAVFAADTLVNTATMNGRGASASYYAEFDSFGVDAWENFSGSTNTAFVNYWRNWTDPSSLVCTTETWWPCDPADASCVPEQWEYCRYTVYGWEYGWAEIDANDFRANAVTAALHTVVDPSRGYVESCTYGEFTGYFCSAGTGPAFDIEWSKVNDWSSHQSGRFGGRWGKYFSRNVGTSRSVSANFDGTAFATTIAGSGSLRSGNNVIVERYVVTP